MDISNFSQVRIGQSYPNCFDISPIQYHESYGIYAKTYIYSKDVRVELRKKTILKLLYSLLK